MVLEKIDSRQIYDFRPNKLDSTGRDVRFCKFALKFDEMLMVSLALLDFSENGA